MAGNSIGTFFRVTTWGESHGEALGAIIDGCPAGIKLTTSDIQKEVNARKPNIATISTPRREEDKVEILSGVFEGKTTGSPISLMIKNTNACPKDYNDIKNVFRPGHADLTYEFKYGHRDFRGGGRSSGRETVARVMAGAIAKCVLSSKKDYKKLKIYGHTIQVGDIFAKKFQKEEISKNPIRCADKKTAEEMQKLIETVREKGDSIGAVIEIIIENAPLGLGDPVFDKLDADLAKAFMSIGGVKGVEFGSGFDTAFMKGSENNDQIRKGSKKRQIEFLSNNSGGILGGISNGNIIVARLAIKPVPSITKLQKTITSKGENTQISTEGRHDACLAPRIIPVAESMAAITILDHVLRR